MLVDILPRFAGRSCKTKPANPWRSHCSTTGLLLSLCSEPMAQELTRFGQPWHVPLATNIDQIPSLAAVEESALKLQEIISQVPQQSLVVSLGVKTLSQLSLMKEGKVLDCHSAASAWLQTATCFQSCGHQYWPMRRSRSNFDCTKRRTKEAVPFPSTPCKLNSITPFFLWDLPSSPWMT